MQSLFVRQTKWFPIVLKSSMVILVSVIAALIADALLAAAQFHRGQSRTFLGASLLAAGVVLVSNYLPARRLPRQANTSERKYDQRIELDL